MMELDGDSSLDAVRAGLTDHDVHPPLYFWGVYAAREAGIGMFSSGPAVNVVAGGLTIVLLYLLLLPIFERRWVAALAVGLFALSPAAVYAGSWRASTCFSPR